MKKTVFFAALLIGSATMGAAHASTLEDVKAYGKLRCGVPTKLVGFAATDASGRWQGFDVDFCRALAAAILSDPEDVEFVATKPTEHFEALASKEIDILVRNTTWTYSHDVSEDFTFIGVNYYDGQGFLIPKALGVTSAKELDLETVCVQEGDTTQLNLADFFRKNNLNFDLVTVANNEEAQSLYLSGGCDVYSSDASALASTRATFENPGDHVVLPEIISKSPMGPLVRQGDDQWADIGRWVLNALIAGEELGVTSANVTEMASSPGGNPEINRLLGSEGNLGEMLDLEPNWAAKAIAANGNYGEIFEKNIGESTPIGIARGLNAQWTNGGLIYALPFR